MIWTARARSNGWERPRGRTVYEIHPRSAFGSPSAPGRRRDAASGARRGSSERRRAGLPAWEDFPFPVSLPGAWSLVTSFVLAGRDTTHDVVDDADLVLLGGSPLSNGSYVEV
jgi:hypothetical protein